MVMRHSSGEKGAALVVVLAIVVMSTALLAVVFHFVQRGTEISGLEQKYETAKDASLGAIDVFAKEVIPLALPLAQAAPTTSLTGALANFNSITSASMTAGATNRCFSDKLLKATANWASTCNSSTDPKTAPDVTFTLKSTSKAAFSVYTKIVDTITGNSNTSGLSLEGGGVADALGSGGIPIQHFPYMYSMEVQGERQQNPSERANFEALYAY
jgi:hypothetical protein